MQLHTQLAWLSLTSYLIGAVPFGLIVGRLKGIDVRKAGSNNIGATNVGRLLGQRFFWLVFLLDLLKSLLPMLLASWLVAAMPHDQRSSITYTLWLGVGLMAMLGHIFPIYLKFRGGKGVATGAGVVLGLVPYFTVAGLISIGIFIVVVLVKRYISLASIIAAASFPIAYLTIGIPRGWGVLGTQLPLLIIASLLSGLIILRHRDNISRLRSGTERRVGRPGGAGER